MAVPTKMADLSTTADSNSPAGSEAPISTDNFHRAIQAILRHTNAKGADISSAATTDIGAATGEFVDVTGTTTITGLGTIAAGIVRTVRFTGALTLTHNATSLILPGGANITTAANDRAVFRSLGSGNWICIVYQRADGSALAVAADTVNAASLADSSLGFSLINGSLSSSVSSNALTIAIKTLAGADPSSSAPVLAKIPNTTGGFDVISLTAATSIVVSSGSTLGTSNSTAFRFWVVGFNDGGTFRMGVINCLSGSDIYPLGQYPVASSTAEGGAGAADSAHTFYTGTAVTSKAYAVLGYVTYESGLATAGTYSGAPSRTYLQRDNDPLPGDEVQVKKHTNTANTNISVQIPFDDTIPQSTEGSQVLTASLTPTSAANLIDLHAAGWGAVGNAGAASASIIKSGTANALAATSGSNTNANGLVGLTLLHDALAGDTSSQTYSVRAGPTPGAANFYLNGNSGGRIFGGVSKWVFVVRELLA